MAHKIERAVLAQRIRELDGLTNDERSALLELLNTKKFGLVWENKPEDVEERLRENLPVLKEVKEKALTQGGDDAPNHIIIEGDNLEALTALTYTHEGKIDVIYIDPPYNTGKEKEFKFNDNYIIKDGINWGFKHTYWLQFMAKRLKIAKRLLSNQGVLISHIDEHEFDAMNMLLREIFGENNSLGQIVWNKLNPKGETTSVAVMHEYLLVFAKNKEYLSTIPNALTRTKPNAKAILNRANCLFSQIGKTIVPADIKNVLRQYGFSISEAKDFKITVTLETVNREFQNWLKKSDFSNGEKAYKYIDPKGNVFTTVSMAAPDKPETRSHRPLIHPFTMQECPVPEKGWRLPDESMNSILGAEPASEILPGIVQQGEVVFSIGRNGIPSQPRRKYLLEENMIENVPSIYNDGTSAEDLFADLKLEFPFPKPTSVGEYLIENILPDANIVLDFFAGSGTTLHATMNLNAKDGRKRQCILVTNNESGICEEITYPRIKAIIDGYQKRNGEQVAGLNLNNLRYYRTEFIPRERTNTNMRALVKAATDLLCIKEDLYDEEKTLGSIRLKPSLARLFRKGNQQMLVIYREEVILRIVEELEKLDFKEKLKVYLFAPGRYAFDDDFITVQDKVSLCALPAAIYDAYQKVLPKRKVKLLPEYEPQQNDELNFEEGREEQ